MKPRLLDAIKSGLFALAIVGLIGLAVILWASLNLFGTGCDPVMDRLRCTPEQLSAWEDVAQSRPR